MFRIQLERENKLKADISTLNSRVVSHVYEKIDRRHVSDAFAMNKNNSTSSSLTYVFFSSSIYKFNTEPNFRF